MTKPQATGNLPTTAPLIMGKPAARVTDMTSHGTPLSVGPGSMNVMIGFLPAWRGIPLAAAAGVQAAQTAADITMKAAEAATKAAAGTPGAPAALAAEQATKTSLLASNECDDDVVRRHE